MCTIANSVGEKKLRSDRLHYVVLLHLLCGESVLGVEK